MKLRSFKALVDERANPKDSQSEYPRERDLLIAISGCFTEMEGDKARVALREIMTDLGLQWRCDDASYDPYFGVADALSQALRNPRESVGASTNWPRAVELGLLHKRTIQITPRNEDPWAADFRVPSMSHAICTLRAMGYVVGLPSIGGVDVPEAEIGRIGQEIHSLSSALGSDLAISAARAMDGSYNAITGRFHLGRAAPMTQRNALPELPLAYLYQLGLRYFSIDSSVSNPHIERERLWNLVSAAVALMDLSVGVWDLVFARPGNVLNILNQSLVYDSVFMVAQAKPKHAQQYLEGLMSHKLLANLKDQSGRTSQQVLGLALMLLRKCERESPSDFSIVDPQRAAYATSLDREPAATMLREVFSHCGLVNEDLTFPPKDTQVDAAFCPLIFVDGRFWMQPPPLAARATVNAALQWCRTVSANPKQFDYKVLGPCFEEFVRAALTKNGVSVLSGSYNERRSKSQCDAVIETRDAVLFLELKSKMMRRAARDGEAIPALVDLAQALVRPQAQAMERHAVLKENGSMRLIDTSSTVVELGSREVLKMSVTRGDLGSIHDRPFLQKFLWTGCIAILQTADPTQQSKLEVLDSEFTKLRDAATRAGEDYVRDQFPFARSWSLSVFHLLLLLERTTDNESFSRELQRTRYVATSVRDFYAEYAYRLVSNERQPARHSDN